jgi:hypothetical protein
MPDLDQIPWAEHVRVVYLEPEGIRLKLLGVELFIEKDGSWYPNYESRVVIHDFMRLDPDLTGDLRRYLKGCPRSRDACIKDWVLGTPVKAIREWRPVRAGRPWDFDTLGQGTTRGHEEYVGDVLEYLHFVTDENKVGAVIRWPAVDAEPEVWMGDFDGFITHQEFPEPEPEDFLRFNEMFENGIIWAYEQLGLFDFDKASGLPYLAVQAIRRDPDILYPAIVAVLEPQLDAVHGLLEDAVNVWKIRRRRELEKATGQKLLWRSIYRGISVEGGGMMLGDSGELLKMSLQAAIPLWIEEYRQVPWEDLRKIADEASRFLSEHGDAIMYRQKGVTREAFNHLARSLAVLSFVPGGVNFMDMHFETPLQR